MFVYACCNTVAIQFFEYRILEFLKQTDHNAICRLGGINRDKNDEIFFSIAFAPIKQKIKVMFFSHFVLFFCLNKH